VLLYGKITRSYRAVREILLQCWLVIT